MRTLGPILAALVICAPARAEITKLGEHSLGQVIKRPTTSKARLYGCRGSLRASTDRKRRVKKVRFEAVGCKLPAVTAAITRAAGKKPISNPAGDKLWEGRRASIILTTHGGNAPLILLVPPGPGAKRPCWSGDGFAKFWTRFRAATGSHDAARIAGSFAFPLKGSIPIADARTFAAKLGDLIDDTDLAAIAGGTLTASCRLEDEIYRLVLTSSNAGLVATRIRGAWRWTRRDDVSLD